MTRIPRPRRPLLPVVLTVLMATAAMGLWTSPAGAQTTFECSPFVPPSSSPSILTLADYDRWILEADGETFVFDDVEPGVIISTGNGADIELAYKCTAVTPLATPTPTPTSTPDPTPEVTPEPTPEATLEPTPTSTPEPSTEPTATPEATATAQPPATPEPTVAATPEPTVPATPEPTPEPTATETVAPTATPEATPTTEVEVLGPDPEEPDDTDQPDDSSTSEVLGSQLANTGAGDTTARAWRMGVTLVLTGFGLVVLGARRRTATSAG